MITPDWQPTISEIVAAPGVAMVVGAVDTGKTRFCLELCRAALEAGVPTAIVDADVGQSEIGAPGTVGMAMVDRPVEALSDLKPKRLHFVGATTPADHMLECVVGTKRMVDAALALGREVGRGGHDRACRRPYRAQLEDMQSRSRAAGLPDRHREEARDRSPADPVLARIVDEGQTS